MLFIVCKVFWSYKKAPLKETNSKQKLEEWESFSILGRQEPKKVVMLLGDGNESWRHWATEYFCGELSSEISLAVLMHHPNVCWEKASDQQYKWVT